MMFSNSIISDFISCKECVMLLGGGGGGKVNITLGDNSLEMPPYNNSLT